MDALDARFMLLDLSSELRDRHSWRHRNVVHGVWHLRLWFDGRLQRWTKRKRLLFQFLQQRERVPGDLRGLRIS